MEYHLSQKLACRFTGGEYTCHVSTESSAYFKVFPLHSSITGCLLFTMSYYVLPEMVFANKAKVCCTCGKELACDHCNKAVCSNCGKELTCDYCSMPAASVVQPAPVVTGDPPQGVNDGAGPSHVQKDSGTSFFECLQDLDLV